MRYGLLIMRFNPGGSILLSVKYNMSVLVIFSLFLFDQVTL